MQWEKYLLVITILFGLCHGHGFLSRPASRNNMRLVKDAGSSPIECPYGADGCTVPDVDYDKQSGAAGGPGVVHATCAFGDTSCVAPHGMCGDKFDADQAHMEGGRFSSGLVNGVYTPGQVIYVDLHITAHHKGYHEFTLYDVSDDANAKTVLTPAVTSYKLQQKSPQLTHTMCEYWNIDPTSKWCMPHPTGTPIRDGGYDYTTAWVLPAGVTCKRCVLQWHWVTGNSPGANPEEFWGCADITIRDSAPFINNNQVRAVDLDEGYAPVATTSGYVQNPTQAAGAPPVSASERTCVAVPGKGASDNWCATVKCDKIYVDGGYCKFAADGSTSTTTTTTAPVVPVTPVTPVTPAPSQTSTSTSTCKAVKGTAATDLWCQQANCDDAYIRGGFCTKS